MLMPVEQENGVATAIEAIYRDLEYARTLIKRLPSIAENTHARKEGVRSPSRASSSRPHSEDWTVVSDQEYRRLSTESKDSDRSKRDRSGSPAFKRNGLAAVALSAVPDAFLVGSSSVRKAMKT
jgi:sterol 3beta-glucosyltransferase